MEAVTIVRPPQVTIFPGARYRILPIWNEDCEVADRDESSPELKVDAIAWADVPLTSRPNNKAFIQIRLPNTRQVYWLGNTYAEETSTDEGLSSLTDQLTVLPVPPGPCPTPTPEG